MNIQFLILDDDKSITDKLSRFFEDKSYSVQSAYTSTDALNIIQNENIDIALLDVVLPDISGITVLKKIKEKQPEAEVIMMSGHGDMDMVIEAMHHGAIDFIKKPFRFVEVQMTLERTSKFLHLQNKLEIAENKFSLLSREMEKSVDRDLIGVNQEMEKLLSFAIKIAEDGNANVLITGENGTGKEIIARIIHYASPRKDHPFSPVNCSAIPESLLESEFFGHRKGAFTDAKENRKGYFELADGGSLFLDEIADMPPALQAKLLRAIEEKKIKHVGSENEFDVDIRLISATNRNLESLIEEKKFRLDLFHRINTFILKIPPLRYRTDDIEPLLKYFVKKFATEKGKTIPYIEKDIFTALRKYYFPGNVRELKNMTERAMILCEGSNLTLENFKLNMSLKSQQESRNLNLEKNEILLIKEALTKTNYNQKEAAIHLGISRDALIRRMRKYKLNIKKNIHFS
jgi:DNA-binding NtrC family response regulator